MMNHWDIESFARHDVAVSLMGSCILLMDKQRETEAELNRLLSINWKLTRRRGLSWCKSAKSSGKICTPHHSFHAGIWRGKHPHTRTSLHQLWR
mmetsp:Transcript_26589/g.61857  ORF Transcript_26589/g.61857 Transcript_26589/m.61857 type:complete len:94 (-) Transcript_26589:395-676(-)